MKPGQTTVLGLELVLLGLIAVRNPNVLGFLKTWLSNFKGAINSTTSASTTATNYTQGTAQNGTAV